MEISIHRATPDRVESFWHALDEVARERTFLLFTEAPPLESTRGFVAGMLGNDGSQFYALEGDRVVGWCDICRHERPGTEHVGSLGIAVLKDYRGRGLGERLLRATIDDAFAKGVERIELEAFASNDRALALYRKLGFVDEGLKRKARFLDGSYDDFVMMALLKDA